MKLKLCIPKRTQNSKQTKVGKHRNPLVKVSFTQSELKSLNIKQSNHQKLLPAYTAYLKMAILESIHYFSQPMYVSNAFQIQCFDKNWPV